VVRDGREHARVVALTWVLAVPAAGLMMRAFIIQHDCGHGSFFRTRALRDALGLCLGVLTVTPYHYWRWTHALHHKDFDKLEQPPRRRLLPDAHVAEYERLSASGRFWYRVYRNPLVFFGFGGAFQFSAQAPSPSPARRQPTARAPARRS